MARQRKNADFSSKAEKKMRKKYKFMEDAMREQEAKREELVQMMNLWPFTAQVVCVAMINAETLRGQVIFIADDFESNTRAASGEAKREVADATRLQLEEKYNKL